MPIAIFIVVIVALAITVVVLAVQDKNEIIYGMIYALVEEAEERYGAGTGKLKFSYVLEKVYYKIPAAIRIFVSYGMLEDMIEKAVAEIQEYWENKAKQ